MVLMYARMQKKLEDESESSNLCTKEPWDHEVMVGDGRTARNELSQTIYIIVNETETQRGPLRSNGQIGGRARTKSLVFQLPVHCFSL